MEIETATSLIDSVGFPIFVCVVLFWFINNGFKKLIETLNNFNIAILNNTNSIRNLISKMEDSIDVQHKK